MTDIIGGLAQILNSSVESEKKLWINIGTIFFDGDDNSCWNLGIGWNSSKRFREELKQAPEGLGE